MSKLKNKVAVITGGSSGIGLAIAEEYANQGAKIVIIGRNKQKLDDAKKNISSKNILTISADISKLSDIDLMYKKIDQHFGKIDILVASAGIYKLKSLKEIDEAFFDSIMDVNCKGLFFTVQKSLNYLNKNSSIILISSVASLIPRPTTSVYSSSKAAVNILTRSFASELTELNIRVNNILPGAIHTPMIGIFSTEVENKISSMIPMKRIGESSEILVKIGRNSCRKKFRLRITYLT
jgi:NAD(P)-dependent dehydrogenase (short-subunit alcohol dehydrogenase family)